MLCGRGLTVPALCFVLTYCLSLSYCLQGADQHVNTGANIYAAAAERRGT